MNFKFSSATIREIGEKILQIRARLESNIASTLWISDLHGDGDRFIRVLQGRFGMLYTTAQEALDSKDDLFIKNITRLIRRKRWSSDIKISRHDALLNLLKILSHKAQHLNARKLIETRHRLSKLLLQINLAPQNLPLCFFDQGELFNYVIRDLSQSILDTIPDRIIVLGDIFDRGPTPEKIIRTLKLPYYKKRLSMIWGNHDILWLAACAGDYSSVAEVVRVTCRYDHLDLLKRLHFDISKLQKFALEFYSNGKIPDTFRAKSPDGRSIEKAIAIIRLKTQEDSILRRPEYQMENRLWLDKLGKLLNTSNTDGLTDTHFPTLNPDQANELNVREKEVIDDLKNQFMSNRKLKNLMSLFIEKALIFDTHQDFLNIHASIPSNAKGDYEELLGRKGKPLLVYIQSIIDRVAHRYLNDQKQDLTETDLMFYLWCGPKSPLYGRHAMKTFERYFIKDKSTHKEKTLHWEKNITDKKFQNKLKKDFSIKRIVFGHTPKDIKKGDKMLSGDNFAINIDGGFSGAYLKRGHALVQTSQNLYGIVLPNAQEAKKVISENQVLPLLIETIEKHKTPLKYKSLIESESLKKEERELIFEIDQLNKIQAETYFQQDESE
ncbi:MAG: fructose-bisphosphatase class III [SAR324 cluster bacterium]|nr:fructose-bisphosphatase class III [SAR324 cluster bacterium]